MGLHHRHTHDRVIRGLDARAHLEMRKRDSHGDHIKMNVPEDFEQKQQQVATDDSGSGANANVATAYTVKYVTIEPTFEITGPVVYSTLSNGQDLPTAIAQNPAVATGDANVKSAGQQNGGGASSAVSLNSDEAAYASAKSAAQNRGSAATEASATVASTTQTVASVKSTADAATSSIASPMTTLATSSAPSMTFEDSNGHVVGSVGGAVAATHSASVTPDTEISKEGSSMSSGAKAGLAFGIIALLALIGVGIFFLIRRRKSKAGQEQEEVTDDKHNSFLVGGNGQLAPAPKTNRFGADSETAPSDKTTANAPRLSLRPVTQFLPGFGDDAKNRKSSSNGLDASNNEKSSAWERRPQTDKQNPFGDAAVLSEKQSQPATTPTANNPFDERPTTASTTHSKQPSWESAQSQKQPPTPQSAQLATAAAVPVTAIAASAAPRPTGPPQGQQRPNDVHRVQLDFKPTMDDELGLRSGDLVRMLHEYDDGWALCVRMDRSQQGVGKSKQFLPSKIKNNPVAKP